MWCQSRGLRSRTWVVRFAFAPALMYTTSVPTHKRRAHKVSAFKSVLSCLVIVSCVFRLKEREQRTQEGAGHDPPRLHLWLVSSLPLSSPATLNQHRFDYHVGRVVYSVTFLPLNMVLYFVL